MSEEQNNWKKISTEVPYENAWIEVQHHQVLNPSGKPGIYGQVNFKNIAIGIVALDEELNTWLVGQYRFPLDEYSWEIPEGGCPLNEEPLDAAKRELMEETGITAQKWTYVSKIHTSNSVCNEVGYVFLAENLSFGSAMPEETEKLKVIKTPLKQAYQWVIEDKITDSISIAAILKVAIQKGIVKN
ncbi:MAG: NUDIX domain-containing protein [Leadbetterella sp.]